MKNKFLASLLLVAATLTSPSLVLADSVLSGKGQEPHIIVNNRILAKANGKAISVIDVMKKMDLLFYRQYPQYSSSVPARFQFYQAHWKSALNEIIDKELILVDAEEMKLKVSPGDVRQEMESLFGPNIIVNLDKAGLTFNEAYQMVLDDITIRRMLYFRVHTKVMADVTPLKIKDYYENYAKENIRDNEWVFNVITVRHADSVKGAEIANTTYHLLAEDMVPLDQLPQKLEELKLVSDKQKTVSISEQFATKEKDLSDAFKGALAKLKSNSYSQPIPQKSRAGNDSVFRIFYLEEMVLGGMIPYQELETKIKNKLLDDGVNQETENYFKKQRAHFDIENSQLEEIFSSGFQPFTLS